MCKCIVWKIVTSDKFLLTLGLVYSYDSLSLCAKRILTKVNPSTVPEAKRETIDLS